MAQEKYDIFISYRRRDKEGNEWGTPIARNIQQALESRGYMGRVFFDHNEIGPEDFEEKILGAIKQSKVFICVLTKDAMDNCVREGDWVRREICQAIESKKKMIFLNPDNQFTYNFPVDFPEELRIVRKGNSIDIRMGQKFELDMDDMVNTHIASIIKPSYMVKRTPIVENDESVVAVRIKTDLDCRIFNCGEELCAAKAGLYTTIRLPLGQNELRFEGLESAEDSYEQFIEIDDNRQRIIRVNLLDKYNARKKAERDAYLLSWEDDEFRPFKNDGKWGFELRQSGEVVIPVKYDFAVSFSDGLARVGLNGKYGFIDKKGEEVVPLKYDDAYSFSDGLAKVELNGKWGFIDKTGKEVAPVKYDFASFFSDGLAKVELNSKYGFIDKIGKEVAPLKYDSVGSFSDGLAIVYLNGKYGFIDKKGEEVILLKYDYADSFSDGLAMVELRGKFKLNGKYGFIDKTGKEVIPLKYDFAVSFSDGLARVGLNGKYGFIDKKGEEVVPLKYDDAYSFSDGLAWVGLNGKYGFIDKMGKEVIPLKYDETERFSYGFAAVKMNGKWGFVNKCGEEICELKYEAVEAFKDMLAPVMLNGRWGCIDQKGELLVYCFYESLDKLRMDYPNFVVARIGSIYYFSELEKLCKISIGIKFGCVDEDDRIIIPCIYDEISALFKMKDSFSWKDDLCGVRIGNAMGVIDASGKILIPCKYEDFGTFKKNELARVRLDGKWGYVDTGRGVEIVPCVYDELWALVDGMIPIRKSDKWGYLNDRGEEVIPCVYDKVQPFKNKFAKVCLNGEWFLIDKNGNKVE